MQNDFRAIGNKLFTFRKRLAMTQSEVAEAAGISDRTYADIERGTVNMRISTFLQICKVLHATPNEILLNNSYESTINSEEILQKLNSCTQKEKDTAYKLINVFLSGLK